MLKIFEPTTLLTLKSVLLLIAATILTASSGRDVPNATMVRPIIRAGTLSIFAIVEAPSTKMSAPLIKNTKYY